jgi:hypothetical protein
LQKVLDPKAIDEKAKAVLQKESLVVADFFIGSLVMISAKGQKG